MTVIKLGGCNGSGKSTIAREVLNHVAEGEPDLPTLRSGKRTKSYSGEWLGVPVIVLGKYDNACGGMDTISDKEDRFHLVKEYAERNTNAIIFFEGLITGKTYGALGALSEEHKRKKIPWIWAFMGAPFDVCVGRVLERRAKAGNDAPFDPERTMRSTFESCERLAQKLRDGTLPPHHVHVIKHTLKPHLAAKHLLNKALEIHHAS
jgi:hypothetical protein